MSYTLEQNIEIIEEYTPCLDMKDLDELIFEAVESECPICKELDEIIWRDLPDRAIEKLAYLCAKESNDFYRKHA